jgi:hypothetical protein
MKGRSLSGDYLEKGNLHHYMKKRRPLENLKISRCLRRERVNKAGTKDHYM